MKLRSHETFKTYPLALWLSQASLAGNTTAVGAKAASIQSKGEPASLEDGIQPKGEPVSLQSESKQPASLEDVGVVFASSARASLDSCADSRRLTYTIADPSPLSSVIDAGGGKADGISSESGPASLKDVIGDGGGTPVASEGESAPMAPVLLEDEVRAHARINIIRATSKPPNTCVAPSATGVRHQGSPREGHPRGRVWRGGLPQGGPQEGPDRVRLCQGRVCRPRADRFRRLDDPVEPAPQQRARG